METLNHNSKMTDVLLDEISAEYYSEYKAELKTKVVIIASAFLFVVIILFSLNTFSQNNKRNYLVAVANERSSTLVNFNAQYRISKVYVNWLVQNEIKDGYYIIERSHDNKNFQTVGIKEGIGTRLPAKLLYSWIDAQPLKQASYYRLKQVGIDGSIISISSSTLISVPNNYELSAFAELHMSFISNSSSDNK